MPSKDERIAELQGALDSRVLIEQAKGVLSERYLVDVDQAFELARLAARSQRRKLTALASDVVASVDASECPVEEYVRRRDGTLIQHKLLEVALQLRGVRRELLSRL